MLDASSELALDGVVRISGDVSNPVAHQRPLRASLLDASDLLEPECDVRDRRSGTLRIAIAPAGQPAP